MRKLKAQILPHKHHPGEVHNMNDKAKIGEKGSGSMDEARIETHCHLCRGELPKGQTIISSKCGVNYHDECAMRVMRCPACAENLLEHFVTEEAKKKMVIKDRIFTILIFALPFVVIEVLIGLWSMWSHPSDWSIPPWFGKAFGVDLILLIVGLLLGWGIFHWFGYKPEKRTIKVFVTTRKGATPGKAEEDLYTCGYGDRVRPFEFGDVSITRKLGVQRDNIIEVRVDRLIMTPKGTYTWVNPRFLKLLPSKINPKPSNPEELERVWRESGRTGVIPEKVEDVEERQCPTCGGPLDFVSDYNAWYCTSCGKYDETTLPPPDDIPPA